MKKFTAVGNMMTANDHGIAMSPLVAPAEAQSLAKAFHTKVEPISVAGLDTTGACVVATNKGFLTNPNASEEEVNNLEAVFKVKGELGSLNYGNPFIKGCVLANSHGAIVGSTSTPFELGRLDDALFFKK
jgi:translation initiation factor 6